MESKTLLKGFTIVVAGKGGTGKTLMSALLVRNMRKYGAVLAIDADPDSNLPEALGVELQKTVGQARELVTEFKTRKTEHTVVTAEKLFEQHVMESIAEEKDFDILAMGRSEGQGCYCAVNHILRSIIDSQAQNYPTVVIDSEAGLEHISRRTARDVDVMLVVTDASARGLSTARRVNDLAEELKVDFGSTVVVVNKITDQTRQIVEKQAKESGMEFLGFIPFDPQLAENDALGKPIWDLPEENPVMKAAKTIFEKLNVIREEKLKKVRSS